MGPAAGSEGGALSESVKEGGDGGDDTGSDDGGDGGGEGGGDGGGDCGDGGAAARGPGVLGNFPLFLNYSPPPSPPLPSLLPLLSFPIVGNSCPKEIRWGWMTD